VKVTVIGGGNGCYAAVADLTEKGHEVCWWQRNTQAQKVIAEAGGLSVKDRNGSRKIPIGQQTSDLSKAVANAELVVIPLPATTHEELAPQLANVLRPGQVVFLPPGTFGSYLFARKLHQTQPGTEVCFAETGTLPYLARKHSLTDLVISGYATRLPTGVFPAQNSAHAFAILEQAYPAIEHCENALSGALMNAGPIIHPPLILMNAGPLEHFDTWDIHNEGTQASIRSVTDSLDEERITLRKALGYGAPHFPLKDHYSEVGEEWMYGRKAHGELTDSGDWRENIDLHAHRYMLEDVALGLSLYTSIGRWASTPMRIADGMLAIASAITGRDLYAEGRTLENLGIAGLSKPQFDELLHSGFG